MGKSTDELIQIMKEYGLDAYLDIGKEIGEEFDRYCEELREKERKDVIKMNDDLVEVTISNAVGVESVMISQGALDFALPKDISKSICNLLQKASVEMLLRQTETNALIDKKQKELIEILLQKANKRMDEIESSRKEKVVEVAETNENFKKLN